MSCGLLAPGSDRSEGLALRDASWGLAGLTPGARPTVAVSEGCVVDSPGTGPPVLFGPLTAEPGVADEPAPLRCCCAAAVLPVVPLVGEALCAAELPLVELDVPPPDALAPELPPPDPPPP
jgi:hypothetical protein